MSRAFRDTFLFALGALGFLHEMVVHGPERPYFLSSCIALMGLPLVLGVDRNRNGEE